MGYVYNPFTGNLVPASAQGSEDALSAKTLILEKQASEPISALKAVYLDTLNTCMLAHNTDEVQGTVAGIALNSGGVGALIRILVFGVLEDPFFTFNLNDRLFLGLNGELINSQPASGVLTGIGYGLGNGAIQISIDKPQLL